MSSDFQAPNENPTANHSEAPTAETAEAKPEENKTAETKPTGHKRKLLLWLNLLWVIPLVVFAIFKCFFSFEMEGTVLVKYRGFATKVVIPEGVTEIGNLAFNDCHSLKSVVIPEGVTVIGGGVFLGCSSLKSVVIPDSVEKIEGNAFAGCTALKEWPISSTHPHFKRDGVGLLTKDGKKLVACLALAKEYQIPEGVTEIGKCAFWDCSSLTSVVIPEGVTDIGACAFYDCSSLKSVVIPEGVTEIGEGAFDACPNLTIHAPAGSYAEEYAKDYRIPFKAN